MSSPYTSQQNGKTERKHNSIVEIGLTLLAHMKMPPYYLWKYLSTDVYLFNRLESSINPNKISHSLVFNKEPNYED